MAKLKSFEQFLSEMDRTEEVQQDVVATAEPVEQSEEKAEEVQGNGDAIEEAVNASGYIKAGKLGYNDQFLGRRSLSYTLSVELGMNPKNEFIGPWLGFDHVSLYATGKKGGTILDDALTGKYTYDELKAAAADFLGIKESIVTEASLSGIEFGNDDDIHPTKFKPLVQSLKKNRVEMEVEKEEGDHGYPEVKLTGKRTDIEKVLADVWGPDSIDDYEDYFESAKIEEVEVVAESGEEAGLPAEDLKDETEVVDNDCETPEDKSKELEAELEDTVDGAGNEEISEGEETEEVAEEETEEVAEEEEETMLVSDMLKEVYESCKNEAKAWEDDAHDEHTVETYMKENAALVGALAAQSLKEMKEDYSVEAYEAACNEMIEAYSKKVNEMKESDSAVGEETPEA